MEIEPERPFLTMSDVAEITVAMRASGQPAAEFHADLIVFLVLTGAPAFEVGRLRREHFAFQPDGSGHVRLHAMKGTTKRSRMVGFTAAFGPMMQRLADRCAGQPIVEPSTIATITSRWQVRLRELLAGKPLTARVLRRSYATAMASHTPLHVVQRMMGHTNLNTTQKYLGAGLEESRAAAERRGASLPLG